MHLKSNKIAIIIQYQVYKVTEELFQYLLKRYQIGFGNINEGCVFIFDSVHLLYYKCQKKSES